MDGKFVSYLRVSTERQGRSGLGIEVQRAAVEGYLNGGAWTLLAEYVEHESGKKADRPKLAEALAHCKITGATLVVAKLDRLSRNARFLLSIVEGSGEGGVVFADMPNIAAGPMGKWFVTQMAAMAEMEGALISARTKDALAMASLRGVKLGGPRGGPLVNPAAGRAAQAAAADSYAVGVGPMASGMRAEGQSLRKIASAMTERGIRRPRGGAWTADAVRVLLARV